MYLFEIKEDPKLITTRGRELLREIAPKVKMEEGNCNLQVKERLVGDVDDDDDDNALRYG